MLAACAGSPLPGRCLDQLDRRPRGEHELVGVFARSPRRRQRVLVAAQPVVEHRGRPVKQDRSRSLPATHRLFHARVDLLGKLTLPAAVCEKADGSVEREPAAGGLGDRAGLFDQRSSGGEVAFGHMQSGALIQRDRQNTERAGIPGKRDVTGREPIPALVGPESHRGAAGEPQPAQRLLRGSLLARKGAERPLEVGAAAVRSPPCSAAPGHRGADRPRWAVGLRAARPVRPALPAVSRRRWSNRPAYCAAENASRYVWRASPTSSGSKLFAALSSSDGASLPLLDANAICPRNN